jgi:hypothetical protein
VRFGYTSGGGATGKYSNAYIEAYVFTVPVSNPEGQPTPTPTVYSACSVVEPAADTSDMFTMPEVTVGWARCMTLGGVSLDLSWLNNLQIPNLNAGTLEIPEFGICFRPVTFGSMYMFGLNIDLDLLASVLLAIAIIRMITRS